jgi:DNA adenine methylase
MQNTEQLAAIPNIPLTQAEEGDLIQLETVIERAEKSQIEEGRALKQIRDRRLYRASYETFAAYCSQKLGLSRQHVHRLIDFADVVDSLSPMVTPPARESHARHLVGLTPQQRNRVCEIVQNQVADRQQVAEASDYLKSVEQVRMSPINGALTDGTTPVQMSGVQTPLRYHGSKKGLSETLISLLPHTHTYIEPFGGGAAVLITKRPAPVEIYNDLDDEVVNFFQVVRDHGEEFQRRLKLTPYARTEFEACVKAPISEDNIEMARRFFVRCRQSFSGRMVDGNWSVSVDRSSATPVYSVVEHLDRVTSRLRRVQIEHRCFRQILGKVHDRSDVVIYADPPYLQHTRSNGKAYRHELTDADHADLLTILTGYKTVRVAISGYDSALYAERLQGWNRYEFPVKHNVTSDNDGERNADRTEILWVNW